MEIKNYISSQEFKALKKNCINKYKEYEEKNKISELKHIFQDTSFEVILTNKFMYEFIPFDIGLSKQKKGRTIKKIPTNKRYVENFFFDSCLYAQKWEIQGNKELFGSYLILSKKEDNFKELYFIQVDKDDHYKDLISYTRIYKIKKNILYLSINGLKETNWHLRIDTLRDEKIEIISKFGPVFNMETTFNILHSNDTPVSITYNNSVYFNIK